MTRSIESRKVCNTQNRISRHPIALLKSPRKVRHGCLDLDRQMIYMTWHAWMVIDILESPRK